MAGSSLECRHDYNEKRQEKRDKLDLILDLLEASSEPVKKTHLLYRTKINHAQLTRYLDLLLDLGMMDEIDEPLEGYLITDKGRVTLQLFSKARRADTTEALEKSSDRLIYHSMLTQG